uniref:Uncharacterized protein n=1 Tax=Caenorhabditis japonica TaxID=281687 RepID=A0A8R1IKE1_CAEJA
MNCIVIVNGIEWKVKLGIRYWKYWIVELNITSYDEMEEITPAMIHKHFYEIFGIPFMDCRIIFSALNHIKRSAIEYINNQLIRRLAVFYDMDDTGEDISRFFENLKVKAVTFGGYAYNTNHEDDLEYDYIDTNDVEDPGKVRAES